VSCVGWWCTVMCVSVCVSFSISVC
jgi:hypothetical protein